MRFAVPVANGMLSMHFGHCQKFAILDADPATRCVIPQEEIDAPPHQPGLLPRWLVERGIQVVIAGGMGVRARVLFEQLGVRVIVGAPSAPPERLVADFLAGTLQVGENVCDH
jgi:predicted Fe-Mo cluster-binding NifX family protein